MNVLLDYGNFIARGAVITVALAISSIFLATAFGFLGCWMKLSEMRILNKIADLYTTVVRGIPELVIMLLLYFGGQFLVNSIGEATGAWKYLELNEFAVGALAIGTIFGAYMTETFRGAALALPKEEIDAAYAFGMNKRQVFRNVAWPHLVRFALPGFSNNWQSIMKSTALVSVIGLEDIVYNGYAAGKATHNSFSFMFLVLAFYLLLTALSDIAIKASRTGTSRGVRKLVV